MYDLIEKKLRGGIMGLKNGSKTANDVIPYLKRMGEINPAMAKEFEQKYIDALKEREDKK